MLLVLALAAIAVPADWVPMRWPSAEAASLDLLNDTPVNCLVVERRFWNPELLERAAARGIVTLGVIRPGDPVDVPRSLSGVVLEGDWPDRAPEVKAPLRIEMFPRSRMRFDTTAPILGTYQAVWPGIHIEPEGSAKAAPSGGPWIDTNSGFLRFARSATPATIWLGNTPPKGEAVATERYLQVISDAAILGARWVLALDEDLAARLIKGEQRARESWRKIAAHVAWFEQNKHWRGYLPAGQLALVQDVSSGALYSGGVLDMIAVKHTPVVAVPAAKVTDPLLGQAKMAINVDPGSLTEAQQAALRSFTRKGGTLLNGPPDWRFPKMTSESITLGKEDVKKLDEIWKELNSMTGRRNLGARLFNVSSMLSNLLRNPQGGETLLHLVNYSGYPVENVTVHVLGRYKSARLITPGAAAKQLEVYEVEEGAGTGVDIEAVDVLGTLILEPAT